MKYLLVVSLIALVCQVFAYDESLEQWSNFKIKHNKLYRSAFEDRVRFGIFQDNLKKIKAHNEPYKIGKTTYTMGINQFADLTHQEFMEYLTKFQRTKSNATNLYTSTEVTEDEVDWRKKGVVTEIKNQGSCGSCWSFSATGALEGQAAIKNGKLISLSEQNLVDCSQNYGNYGCNGGLMDSAFDYVRDNGITSEEKYPYTAMDGVCQYDKSQSVLSISGLTDVQSGSEKALQSAVSKIGPISVGVDASYFQLYESGIFYEDWCSTSMLNHGILAVGYGTENNQDYWIVKNSWGPEWGENGYIRMSRNRDNNCGIATDASYPVV